jgi:hypothetical protein
VYRQEALVVSGDDERGTYETAASESQTFAVTLSFWKLPTWLAVLPLVGGVLGQQASALEGAPVDDPDMPCLLPAMSCISPPLASSWSRWCIFRCPIAVQYWAPRRQASRYKSESGCSARSASDGELWAWP